MKIQKENRQLQQFKANLFYLGIMTLVTVVIWVGMSVYFQYTKITEDPSIEKLIKPIRPNLEIESFQVFAGERLTLPETFTITAVETEGKTKSTITIDPFSETMNE